MNKIFIIIQREFFSRVKKRSFLILTFLTPLLIAGIYAFMIWMMLKEDTEKRTIAVLNESELIEPIKNSEFTTYDYIQGKTFENIKSNMEKKGYYAILVIPKDILETKTAKLFSYNQVTIEVKSGIGIEIRQHIEKLKRSKIIAEANMPNLEEKLAATKTPISMQTIKFGEDGEVKQSSTEVAMGIGIALGFVIYLFIFLYGSQVMRGVIEEKSNRIVEVIISSVKPFQLMMGKIIGVAMVGLTQFIMWVVLTGIIIIVGSAIILPGVDMETLQQVKSVAELPADVSLDANQLKMTQDILGTFDLGYIASIVGAFIFFFLGGYLLYSALFAAIGSAVDNETETQQFMLPITIPLVLAIYIGFAAVRNPESSFAFWGSIIPFTSPIVMLVRIPFGVPIWELLVSILILIGTFLLITWAAAKIYRTGILMYGKKISYKEIWKWLKYHN